MSRNDWDTPIRELAIVPPGLPDAPRNHATIFSDGKYCCLRCGAVSDDPIRVVVERGSES